MNRADKRQQKAKRKELRRQHVRKLTSAEFKPAETSPKPSTGELQQTADRPLQADAQPTTALAAAAGDVERDTPIDGSQQGEEGDSNMPGADIAAISDQTDMTPPASPADGVPITTPESQQYDLPEGAVRGTTGEPKAVYRIAIDEIVLEGDRRAVQPEKVHELAESMCQIGLQTPITVRRVDAPPDGACKFALLVGLHRLESAKLLGWLDIEAFVMEFDDIQARLWVIDENLKRAELTVLERAELHKERAELVRQKTKVGHVAQPGGQQPADKGISKVARDLGLTREEARRLSTIANVSMEAKAIARDLGLGDNQAALLKIAKETTPEAQVAKVRELAERKGEPRRKRAAGPDCVDDETVKAITLDAPEPKDPVTSESSVLPDGPSLPAIGSPPTTPREDGADSRGDAHAQEEVEGQEQAGYDALVAAWNAAPIAVQQRFVNEVVKTFQESSFGR
jgi:ParB-like nuclease domain